MGETLRPEDVESDAGIRRLAAELVNAEPVRMQMPALGAYTILGIFQVAWRHPGLSAEQKLIIEKAGRDLQDAIASRAPFAAETLELGWNPEHDRPLAAKLTAAVRPAPPVAGVPVDIVRELRELGGVSPSQKLAHAFLRGLDAALAESGYDDEDAQITTRFNTRKGITADDYERVVDALETLEVYFDGYAQVVGDRWGHDE